MTTLYVESSALAAMVFEGDEEMSARVAEAPAVITSVLTILESKIALRRAAAEGRIGREGLRAGDRLLAAFRDQVNLLYIDDRVLSDAERPFPVEPVRSLDAIHLATIRIWSGKYGPITVATHDRRVRANAVALGIPVLP